ncbi:uncharacterized protein LOC130800904 [Amaranthus tricolor]|uniref:uncharacterized protein LOC130800904 n=1 Tax=Amaranthus tricolor TaxID=29722 RepID=UPI002584A572|nr:uncharacterized protein LOC130800904 [Amaranthus tricolor]XP_057520613.1 uncharacterized protein LOC130800904 [Amaranthus tricolor]
MGSMITGKRPSENGDCSLLMSQPRCKRRKVSVIRDFPNGCGPQAKISLPVKEVGNKEQKEDDVPRDLECNGEKGKDLCEMVKRLSPKEKISPRVKEVGNGGQKENVVLRNGEKSRDLCEIVKRLSPEEKVYSKSHEVVLCLYAVKVEKSYLVKCEEVQRGNEDSSMCLIDGMLESSNARKDASALDLEEPAHAVDNKIAYEGNNGVNLSLLPHYPIPPNFVWKEPKYPPQRKISAIRDFPDGCGRNVPRCGVTEGTHVTRVELDLKDDKAVVLYYTNLTAGEPKDDNALTDQVQDLVSGIVVDTRGQFSESDKLLISKSSESKGQDENFKDENDEHTENDIELIEYNGKDEADMSKPDELNKEIIVYDKDKSKRKPTGFPCSNVGSQGDVVVKNSQPGFPCSNVGLQGEDIVGAESGNKILVVQDLMSAPHCSWRQEKVEAKSKSTTMSVRKKKVRMDDSSRRNSRKGSPTSKDDTQNLAGKGMNIPFLEEEIDDVVLKTSQTGFPCSNVGLQGEDIVVAESGKKFLVVQGLISVPHCPWRPGKVEEVKSKSATASVRKKKVRMDDTSVQSSHKCSPTSKDDTRNSAEKGINIPYFEEEIDLDDSSENDEANDFQFLPRGRVCDVSLFPFGASSSSQRGVRSKVRETLRLFQVLHRKLLQEEETAKSKDQNNGVRADIQAAKILKDLGKYINTKKIVGPIPGVEVGDIFNYRIELAIIGLHGPLQGGIGTIKIGKQPVAISIVASGGYANEVQSSDVLIYTGQGGNGTGADKQPEDQKLERGNLALKNCIDKKTLVRVVRGCKDTKSSDTHDGRARTVATYTYDGLYTVEKYWHDLGPHGKLVYKFELRRVPGQPELAWEVKQSKKFKAREGRCVADISEGKEIFPICAVNTISDEKPPPFGYMTSMMYPNWCQPIPPKGCDCKNGCSDSAQCACALKNGGEIPFNHNGAIVQAKPLVYECGPLCKCPPSCHNRVSQLGIKLPLEIFKTDSRGWGVRCLSAIPSGSFICEYIGELLDDKEAEQRTGNDEYLFDIGQNYDDSSLWEGLSTLLPDVQSNTDDVVENIGFTIDAVNFGNIGRFINHSCTPNLYAQNVLYDHEDKRIPHIMFFAAENIPPLQELTYHYNYTIDQVFDSEGNIKKKSCYCGSSECTGRMY